MKGDDVNRLDDFLDQAIEQGHKKIGIGYIRVSGDEPKNVIGDKTRNLHFNKKAEYLQNDALQKFCELQNMGYAGSVVETQNSRVIDDQKPFQGLKNVIETCDRRNVILVYCELGSVFKHPEFFELIRRAKKMGVEIAAVRDEGAMIAAQTHIKRRRPKKFTKKGDGKRNKYLREIDRKEVDPFNEFKIQNNLKKRRFKTLVHLVSDADPIYKYYLTENTRNLDDPEEWKITDDNNKVIARKLNDMGHLTVEGYRWNNELCRRVKELIKSDLFNNFFLEKQMVAEQWESGIGTL